MPTKPAPQSEEQKNDAELLALQADLNKLEADFSTKVLPMTEDLKKGIEEQDKKLAAAEQDINGILKQGIADILKTADSL